MATDAELPSAVWFLDAPLGDVEWYFIAEPKAGDWITCPGCQNCACLLDVDARAVAKEIQSGFAALRFDHWMTAHNILVGQAYEQLCVRIVDPLPDRNPAEWFAVAYYFAAGHSPELLTVMMGLEETIVRRMLRSWLRRSKAIISTPQGTNWFSSVQGPFPDTGPLGFQEWSAFILSRGDIRLWGGYIRLFAKWVEISDAPTSRDIVMHFFATLQCNPIAVYFE